MPNEKTFQSPKLKFQSSFCKQSTSCAIYYSASVPIKHAGSCRTVIKDVFRITAKSLCIGEQRPYDLSVLNLNDFTVSSAFLLKYVCINDRSVSQYWNGFL